MGTMNTREKIASVSTIGLLSIVAVITVLLLPKTFCLQLGVLNLINILIQIMAVVATSIFWGAIFAALSEFIVMFFSLLRVIPETFTVKMSHPVFDFVFPICLIIGSLAGASYYIISFANTYFL